MLLSSVSIFASENAHSNEKESFSFCIKEDQKIDTSNWITFPITFGEMDDESSTKEYIKISFPVKPKFVEEDGLQASYFTATDNDGMVFSIASMQIPEDNFNLQKYVDFLAESISKSASKKLVAYGRPHPNPNDSRYSLMWVEDGKMTMLTLVKGAHFIYFLETNVHNEIYRNIDKIELGTKSFDTMIKDSLKTGTFTKSLAIGN